MNMPYGQLKGFKNITQTLCMKLLEKVSREFFLQKLINRLGLEHCVKLLGYKDHNVVLKKLNNSHIFLLASYTTFDGEQEGIPNVLMEAMATGLPIVATDHSGIPELVKHGISGFIAKEKDKKGLAKLILKLIQNQNIWGDMGKAGSLYVNKEHNNDLVNKKIINIFNLLLRC